MWRSSHLRRCRYTGPIASAVNYWTGKRGMEFEKKFAEWEGSAYAISCTNGTAALHIALASLGVGPGDEVIVPSYSFIASSFCAVQAGAIPVFADVTEEHTLDPTQLPKLLTKRTKAIVVVHLYGVVADMGPISSSQATQALRWRIARSVSAPYEGRKSASWVMSDVSASAESTSPRGRRRHGRYEQ